MSVRAASWALLALAAMVLLAANGAAHSELDSSRPAAGERLAEAPRWVELRFTAGIDPSSSSLRVLDGNGTRVDRDDLRTSDASWRPVLNASLQDGLGAGAYRIQWSVLSDDGHPISGTVVFAVGANATLPDPDGGSSADVDRTSVLGRFLSYSGLSLAFGAIAWRWALGLEVPGLRRPLVVAFAAGALLHGVGSFLVAVATKDAAGLTMAELSRSDVGRLLLLRVSLAAAAFVGAVAPARRWRGGGLPAGLAAVLMVAAGLCTAAVGHAASHGVPGLVADALHLVSAATWVGGLALLVPAFALATRSEFQLRTAEVRRIGLRFGTLALGCVIVLVVSGIATTVVILGKLAFTDPLHLVDTLYGRLLFAKVGLAAVMVALAAANRLLFLPAQAGVGWRARLAELGPDGTARGLRRTVAVELAVGFVVLAVAAVLTAVSPADHAAGLEDHAGHAAMVAQAVALAAAS